MRLVTKKTNIIVWSEIKLYKIIELFIGVNWDQLLAPKHLGSEVNGKRRPPFGSGIYLVVFMVFYGDIYRYNTFNYLIKEVVNQSFTAYSDSRSYQVGTISNLLWVYEYFLYGAIIEFIINKPLQMLAIKMMHY